MDRNRIEWRTLVNTVMNHGVLMLGISWAHEQVLDP
jgi:hypothetical protein